MNTLSDTKVCNFYSSVMRQQAFPEVQLDIYLVGGGDSLYYEREGMCGNCFRGVNCRLWFHLGSSGQKVNILPIKVFLRVLCTNNKLRRLLYYVEDNVQF